MLLGMLATFLLGNMSAGKGERWWNYNKFLWVQINKTS